MKINSLFERDIFRPINGVVKADQLDESSVWQELEEFVITRELDGHLRRFFSAYLDALDRPGDPDVAGKIGIWISGFFGSGKSHLVKVLSYLLRNGNHTHNGQSKQAVEFFESKVKDAMLFGDIKRAVASDTDVVLFNIDSKADHRAGRDAILQVFLKVLNEMQGYSSDHPHIAHMERYLDGKGKLQTFQQAYRDATGTDWLQERDAYHFNRDEVVTALAKALGQSQAAVEKWIDGAEDDFSLTVENFCKWVKEYLDSKGPDHRLIFLVDEVGQFIGTDSHLMLNLQTITENLGTICKGRAWVVVTSQEDSDLLVGSGLNLWRGNGSILKKTAHRLGAVYTAGVTVQWIVARECKEGKAMRTEREKMLAGEMYNPLDLELVVARERARDLCWDLNATRERHPEERRRILQELFGAGGDEVWLQPPFFCDYGVNIRLGKKCFFNFNCVVLDVCPVTIGDHCQFGPAVQIYAATHPLEADLRRVQEFGKPVVIGSDVWVGGGAIICPGVTIGDRCVIGAGSVVTRNIPAGTIAAGNPCRVLRQVP